MKQYIFSIPTPCNNRWEEMTPTAQGRYCNSCAKQVVDFSGMSDGEIIAYVKQHGMVCGRFMPSQLDREMYVPRQRKLMPAALLAGFLMTVLPGKGKAQAVKTDTTMSPVQGDTMKTNMMLDYIERPAIRDTDQWLGGKIGGMAVGIKIEIPTRKKKNWFKQLFG